MVFLQCCSHACQVAGNPGGLLLRRLHTSSAASLLAGQVGMVEEGKEGDGRTQFSMVSLMTGLKNLR